MNAYQVYRQMQAQTAAPGELVVMLYRGAVRFISSAIAGIQARDIESAHTNLVKAQAVLAELSATLDLERGGDIAAQLLSLYDYFNRRLIEANLRKDPEPAREVERLLRELLPAWERAAREASPQGPRPGTFAEAAA
ncbi:MAG: flagellar export chaperone FliS [Chloroflexota bacterium]|nr:flagellar export chaperone FliS [Chloroflexota bacterium]